MSETAAEVLRTLKVFAIGFALVILGMGARWPPRPIESWIALLLFIAMLLTIAYHTRRAYVRATCRHRLASRRCPRCGYDLRASPGRCPECGRPDLRGSRRARGEL